MEISLCYNSSENNTIGKNINILSTTSAVIKGALSKEAPTLLLSYNGNLAEEINYIYIPDLERYYFIQDIVNLTGGRYEVSCRVDVLESFKDKIKLLNVIIDKTSEPSKANMYINDGSFIATQKEFTRILKFGNGFNENGTYILITAGG